MCVSAEVLRTWAVWCSYSEFGQFDSVLGVSLYSYLCHCNDFTPNSDVFIKCVNKYIKVGTESVCLDRWWWGNLAHWGYFFLIIKLKSRGFYLRTWHVQVVGLVFLGSGWHTANTYEPFPGDQFGHWKKPPICTLLSWSTNPYPLLLKKDQLGGNGVGTLLLVTLQREWGREETRARAGLELRDNPVLWLEWEGGELSPHSVWWGGSCLQAVCL